MTDAHIVGIDPGARRLSWCRVRVGPADAAWSNPRDLFVGAGDVSLAKQKTGDAATLVYHWAREELADDDLLVVERPVGKIQYNVFDLGVTVGALVAAVPCPVWWVTPSTWKKAIGAGGNATQEHYRGHIQEMMGRDNTIGWTIDTFAACGIALYGEREYWKPEAERSKKRTK